MSSVGSGSLVGGTRVSVGRGASGEAVDVGLSVCFGVGIGCSVLALQARSAAPRARQQASLAPFDIGSPPFSAWRERTEAPYLVEPSADQDVPYH